MLSNKRHSKIESLQAIQSPFHPFSRRAAVQWLTERLGHHPTVMLHLACHAARRPFWRHVQTVSTQHQQTRSQCNHDPEARYMVLNMIHDGKRVDPKANYELCGLLV